MSTKPKILASFPPKDLSMPDEALKIPLPIYVKDLHIPSRLITLNDDHTLREGLVTMLTHKIRHLPIVSKMNPDMLCGILSERDVRISMKSPVLSSSSEIDKGLDEILIGQIMTKADIYYVTPKTTLLEAVNLINMAGVGALPVINPDNWSLVSIVSQGDLLAILALYLARANAGGSDASTSLKTTGVTTNKS